AKGSAPRTVRLGAQRSSVFRGAAWGHPRAGCIARARVGPRQRGGRGRGQRAAPRRGPRASLLPGQGGAGKSRPAGPGPRWPRGLCPPPACSCDPGPGGRVQAEEEKQGARLAGHALVAPRRAPLGPGPGRVGHRRLPDRPGRRPLGRGPVCAQRPLPVGRAGAGAAGPRLGRAAALQLGLAARRPRRPARAAAPGPLPGAAASPAARLPVPVSAPPSGGGGTEPSGTSCCGEVGGEGRTRTQQAKLSPSGASAYRCAQGLRQGLFVWRQEVPSEFDLAYADFLSLDISMLRLFETFLETTPQLVLVLAIMLQSGQAEYYQWVSICTSFLGISWALLDYHRALRTCLPSKALLRLGSSVICFLWNLLLLWPRVLVVALFSALFPRYVALHFLGLWLVLLFWVWLQGTDFMPDPCSEWLYRATVATILYFSWFNVAEGHTRGRATIHLMFLLSDSILMVVTWVTHSTWLPSGVPLQMLLPVGGTCFLLGLVLRLVYYHWLHPSCRWEPDGVDGTQGLRSEGHQRPQNRRMARLAQNFFPKTRDEPWKGEVNGVL
uniref:XK-related protein n=1 Tax=Equus asinus TaxID=9793 RepID=A0A9L0JSM8_EQUAS